MTSLRAHWFAFSSLILLTLAALAFTVWQPITQHWMQETSRHAGFVLSNLKISGTERTAERDVLALLDIDAGMPLMSIDLDMLQERIEALPWVRRATVTRVLPGDINIVIEERQPFALWQKDEKLRLIDPDGVVITRHGLAAFSHLPMLVGEGAPEAISSLSETLETDGQLAARIKTVIRVGERRWDLMFRNGIRVKLPDNSKLEYGSKAAWQRFVRLEKKHRLLAREVSVIDMRVQDRLIMRVTPAGRRMMDGKEWAT